MRSSPSAGATGLALFDTAIGRCGVAWSGRGLVVVQLPERDDATTLARVRRGAPDAVETPPPPAIRAAIDGIVALLAGGRTDLTGVPLDLDGVPPFHRRIYDVVRAIPPGATLTYGEVAARAGEPGAARAVGQAMGRNPVPIVVPCHRVLAAGSRPGGFSAPGGVATKRRLLAIEGVPLEAPLPLFEGASAG